MIVPGDAFPPSKFAAALVAVELVLLMVVTPGPKQKSRLAVGGNDTLQDGTTRYPASRKTAKLRDTKKVSC